jgi:hypothetical protein
LETLLNILTTHGGSFQKFEFEFRSGISSNTCEQDFRKITCTVADAVPIRPKNRSHTRQCPLALHCRSLTGSSRTPASGWWKSFHRCLPVVRPVRTRGDRCRGHEHAVARAEEPQYPARATHASDVTARAAATGKVSRQTPTGNPSSRALPCL